MFGSDTPVSDRNPREGLMKRKRTGSFALTIGATVIAGAALSLGFGVLGVLVVAMVWAACLIVRRPRKSRGGSSLDAYRPKRSVPKWSRRK